VTLVIPEPEATGVQEFRSSGVSAGQEIGSGLRDGSFLGAGVQERLVSSCPLDLLLISRVPWAAGIEMP
jgi:hypothetical protein